MANIQNLKPFQKGHKGVGGRPKGSKSLTVILKKLIETEVSLQSPLNGKVEIKNISEWIAINLILQALNGDVKAIKEIFDRIDGRVTNKAEPIHESYGFSKAKPYSIKEIDNEIAKYL